MSTLEDQKVTIIPPKLAKRRRRLPASPPRSGTDQQQPPKKLSVEAELSRLPPEVMKELRSFDNNDKFMPGKVSLLLLHQTCQYLGGPGRVHGIDVAPTS